MACVACGAETRPGVLMCSRCLGSLEDPLSLVPRMQDPTADSRLFHRGSLIIRIGPVAGEDVELGRGVEPALRLRSLLEKKDEIALGAFVDKYLAGAGVGLHLWGDERLPKRSLVWNVVSSIKGGEGNGQAWGRASLRIGNVHSLIVKNAAPLPVDGQWLSNFLIYHTREAEKAYVRGRQVTELSSIADSDLAMLRLFSGKGEEALGLLEPLSDASDPMNMPFIIKRAVVLDILGRKDGALAELAKVPTERMDRRALALKLRLEDAR